MNEQLESLTATTIKPYSVTELTKSLKEIVEKNYGSLWVQGEISNFSTPISGHWYLTLKDHESQITAVCFKGSNRRVKFAPEDGLEVLCHGRLSIYEPRGTYQLIIDYIEPIGRGALQLAFEQLKERLSKEGLFDPKFKKEIPFLPKNIAVITSPTGAAIRDFLKVIDRRFSGLRISIVPVPVQGDEAAPEIVSAIKFVNELEEFDLIVLTRGGGSLEDLWPFNEEIVARAIFESKLPIISAIGHEIDFTIADFVSDLRAPTPSAAAEMIIGSKIELLRRIEDQRHRLIQSVLKFVTLNKQKILYLKQRLIDPRKRLADIKLHLDDLTTILINAIKIRHLHLKKSLEKNIAKLEALSPLSVLNRGFSIVTDNKSGALIDSVSKVEIGDSLKIKLSNGIIICEVVEVLST